MCGVLNIKTEKLHNAVNDAYFTMEAYKEIVNKNG